MENKKISLAKTFLRLFLSGFHPLPLARGCDSEKKTEKAAGKQGNMLD